MECFNLKADAENNCIYVFNPTNKQLIGEINSYGHFAPADYSGILITKELKEIIAIIDNYNEIFEGLIQLDETTDENKQDCSEWTTNELFDYAQENELIDQNDTFEDWMHNRTDLYQLVQYHLDNN